MSDERVSDEQLCQIVQYDFAGTVAKQIARECQQHRQREREWLDTVMNPHPEMMNKYPWLRKLIEEARRCQS